MARKPIELPIRDDEDPEEEPIELPIRDDEDPEEEPIELPIRDGFDAPPEPIELPIRDWRVYWAAGGSMKVSAAVASIYKSKLTKGDRRILRVGKG